jgi:hypothetical protein
MEFECFSVKKDWECAPTLSFMLLLLLISENGKVAYDPGYSEIWTYSPGSVIFSARNHTLADYKLLIKPARGACREKKQSR